MPETTKRIRALLAALDATYIDLADLIGQTKGELAAMPERLRETPEAKRKEQAITLLTEVATGLNSSVTKLHNFTGE